MADTNFLAIKLYCSEEIKEILIAELSAISYDSMMETEDGLEAYIEEELFDDVELNAVLGKYSGFKLSYEVMRVAPKNWNEEWEKNYDPIEVEKEIYVHATFHETREDFQYNIAINPRMSFGTGHHATTYLMLKNQLGVDHTNKHVLDAGTGTAILAIMAEKLGASEVIAYDNNSWSTENAPENVSLNHCRHVKVLEGTIRTLQLDRNFDIILANINKNVLLDEMKEYVGHLVTGGKLLLSGFYENDNDDLIGKASSCGLGLMTSTEKNGWSSLIFHKK
ncbi:50S ribosomal protein L11 methyltransferase [Fulvivirga sp. M361]|uniref:50S ribosomal protein L11 methyltransferase n=1 Tax=Fulvivirga sp. M361 TaxID=2594266 RepID=UPI00117A613D|nr:50S ribosomal protein L11 methyltransferase [Fulvivirga sp. M361]TRX62689.1 50S ribosomal protein L11 methyltransferase [Fulvivirga sp. M361]